MAWPRKAPELAVAAAVIAVYLWACCSVVVPEGLSAGPFDLAAVYGFSCALTGWMDYPFGWLANPLVWAGVVLLACRRSGAAAVCGLLAAVPAVQWSLGWDRQGLSHLLRAGYYLWLASIGLLVAGGSTVWAARTRGQRGRPNRASQQTGAA